VSSLSKLAYRLLTQDSLGRSSGEGSFAIWTHNLKGREWLKSFIPENAPSHSVGVPAVTLQAGEQWFGKRIGYIDLGSN
jgi:hypothetical protein